MEILCCSVDDDTNHKFKIDLIVWKQKLGESMKAIGDVFKIDLIVWKYGLFLQNGKPAPGLKQT